NVTVHQKENSGKADTLNYGIHRSKAPIVVCMDSDSRLTANALRYAIRHFNDQCVGAVAGNVKVINRHNIWTKLQALEYIEGLNIVRNAQAFFRSVNVIPGPIGIFRRSAIEATGGYDSDTFAEDFDMTVKILAAGWKINYEPKAVAYTEAPVDQLGRQRDDASVALVHDFRRAGLAGHEHFQQPVLRLDCADLRHDE